MNQMLEIRTAETRDIAALSKVATQTYAAAFGHTFSAADLTMHMQKNLSPDSFSRIIAEDVVLLAELGNRIVGYVQFGAATTVSPHPEDRELRRLYVDAEFQNKGYGAALMQAALHHPHLLEAPNIYLDVWEHNHGAQRFYKRYNFEMIGTRTFKVESGADTSLDLLMVRRFVAEGA